MIRFYDNNWHKIHESHCFQVNPENINFIIIEDDILTFGIIF